MRVFLRYKLVQIYDKTSPSTLKISRGVNSKMSRYLLQIVSEIVIVRKNNDVDEG